MSPATVSPRLPVADARNAGVRAEVGLLPGGDDRPVAWFRGSVGREDAPVVARLVQTAIDTGIPIVGILEQMGLEAEPTDAVATPNGDGDGDEDDPALRGLDLLDGWGAISRVLSQASGVVPTALVLDGPCLGGPALAVGLVDLVVMTSRSQLFVNRPEASMRMSGTNGVDPGLGGPWHHVSSSGLARAAVHDVDEALALVSDVLSFLPGNNHEPPPFAGVFDPPDRPSDRAAEIVPDSARASYDVRQVIGDLVDDELFVELDAAYGTSLVVGLARIAGLPVGVVANQPSRLAGALDIDSSVKGARFVRWCDTFNLPLVTLVDTPGFRPGRDQEWQGIVRHGAKLAFAYAEATVPRLSVVLRKAYGGAYIVMDCKAMGSDCTLAWPQAEIAVMGARGAVEILHRRALAGLPEDERAARRDELETIYAREHLSPRVAAQRGFVDAVVEPAETRRTLAEALTALTAKTRSRPARRHDNIPL